MATRFRFVSVVSVATTLLLAHVAVVALIGPSWRGGLLSNLIQLALGILTVVTTWQTARRCSNLGRYFWTLASISYSLWVVGQTLGTYSESFRPGFGEWLSNFLFFCWLIPIGLTLLLVEDPDVAGLNWLRIIDFSQVGLFWTAAYFYFRVTSHPDDSSFAPGLFFVCYGVITTAFFLRAWISGSEVVRALLKRAGSFLLLSQCISAVFEFGPAKNLPCAAWFDVLWSLPIFASAVAAAKWNKTEVAGSRRQRPIRANHMVLAELFSLLYPVLTLIVVLPILNTHTVLSTAAVLLSLAGTGARLLITQRSLVIARESLWQDLLIRTKAEEAMRESEERFRGAFDFAAVGMAIVAPNGRWLRVNHSLCNIVGYSQKELLEMDFQSITHPDDLEQDSAVARKLLEGSIPYFHIEKRFFHKEGTIIWVFLSVSLVRDARGEPLYSVAQIQDITKRKNAEEAHRQSEERFAKAFRSNPQGIAISRRSDGRILEANDACIRMMGYERSEFIGKRTTDLAIWGSEERNAVLAKLAQEESIRNYETEFRANGGKAIRVQVSLEQIQVQQEPCLLVSIRDITESRLLEQRLRAAQKMEAVGRLAGGVAHDFNNLLMIISGSAQIMQSTQPDTDANTRYLAQIRSASDKGAALTRQLLAFSRQQLLNPTVLNLNTVVKDLWKLLPRLLGEDVETVLDLASDLASVNADRSQIEQVIMNLAVNARDAMPKGGKLVLETANVELDHAAGSRHGAGIPPGRYVMLAVTDTGVGMDADTQARIFEPFFTTKELGKGTGLGLATVYGIVKQSVGYVWVYSELGKGTSFKVYLPSAVKSPSLEPASESTKTPEGGEETILLVEDEVALRELTAAFLESHGYKVLEAGSREDALRVCSEHNGPIHAMLTDVVLPGGGGPDLAKAALTMRPDLRMIYMSGYTDRVLRTELIGGSAYFLQKPFRLDALARTLRTSLDSPPLVDQKLPG